MKKLLTKKQERHYLKVLKIQVLNKDQEDAHINADEVLKDILHDMGYWDIVEVYNTIAKWYA